MKRPGLAPTAGFTPERELGHTDTRLPVSMWVQRGLARRTERASAAPDHRPEGSPPGTRTVRPPPRISPPRHDSPPRPASSHPPTSRPENRLPHASAVADVLAQPLAAGAVLQRCPFGRPPDVGLCPGSGRN